MKVIDFHNVWEKYRIKFIREEKVFWEEIWALENINLGVEKGEVVGVIGENGAGKTTLLKLIAGMLVADRGTVNVNGKVSTLMELGAGFNPEFTGRENIILNARMYGLDEDNIKGQMGKIIDFAGLGKFIDAPIKYYSQGMCMRLAFALAIFVEPDILLIDDILAVGDEEAQQKCINKIFEFQKSGKTIVVVSHNMNMIKELCNRVILLEKGKIIQEGLATEVTSCYLERVKEKKTTAVKTIKLYPQRTISSGALSLFADLENKVIELYYKDTKITKGRGLDSPFCVSQRWFSLINEDEWKVQKISQEELVLNVSYQSVALSQIWTLTCKEEDTLGIKIEIEAKGPVLLTNQDVILQVTDKYKDWRTAYEEGNFLSGQYVNNIVPIRLKDNKVSQVALESETSDRLPYLFFETSSQPDKQILGIYKRREELEEYVCLNLSPIITMRERLINPGRYTYFEGKIILGKEIRLKEEYVSAGVIELSKGRLRFVFDRGRGRIFFEGKELTTGLGVYTSVRSCGVWNDSYQAVWKIKQKDDNRIVVSGDWSSLPISQTSQIELIEENSILWKVDTEIHEEVSLEIEQANLMFLSEYKTWGIPGICKGEFIDEYTQDYDILPFRFWYGKSDQIEIKASDANPPSILFKCNQKDGHFRAIVENTDYLYKARLIQYQKSNHIAKLSPQKYTLFEGAIKIGPKE